MIAHRAERRRFLRAGALSPIKFHLSRPWACLCPRRILFGNRLITSRIARPLRRFQERRPSGGILRQAGRRHGCGHPKTSKLILFEAFVHNVISLARSNKEQWAATAIFVTFDEGGGYYDSGFIQPVDFFGTWPRIPMIAVTQYSKGGHIKHSYTEHSSFVKFVERNWHLGGPGLCARHVVAAQFRRLPVELVLAFNGDNRLDM